MIVFVDDKKQTGAASRSQYYIKHGNPLFGGISMSFRRGRSNELKLACLTEYLNLSKIDIVNNYNDALLYSVLMCVKCDYKFIIIW